MKNIETPLTWGLGILGLVLILLSSLILLSYRYHDLITKSIMFTDLLIRGDKGKIYFFPPLSPTMPL